MALLLAFLISLLPLSALAQVQLPPHAPTHQDLQGWNVIPDGQGGVTYWRGQGGTDAYTANIIGQGMTRQFQQMQTPTPRYTPPPLEVPQSRYRTDREIDRDVCATMIRC